MLLGSFFKMAGQTVRKKYTISIFTSIVAIRIAANFFGLFSFLSLAKGNELNASKPMISAHMVIYSGCPGSPMNAATGALNNTVRAVIHTVEIRREVLSVL